VLFGGPGFAETGTDVPGHTGYLAGRYRNGAYSDVWTDVSRCAEGTFVGYAAACTCGWRGPVRRADDVGRVRCRREWATGHLAEVAAAGPAVAPPADRAPARVVRRPGAPRFVAG
jgi:hypothetical protein